MKTLIQKGLPLLAATLFAAGTTANAQVSTSGFCNNWLIAGVYGFTIDGTKLGGPAGSPLGPQVGVAMTQFDGKGGLQQTDAVNIGGFQVSDFDPVTHPVATGSYQVNPDCTGSFTIKFTLPDTRPPVTTYFVVVDNGKEIDTVVVGVAPGPGATPVIATRSIGKRRFSWTEE